MKVKYLILFFLITALVFIFSSEVAAQCPMCKMSAETNLRDGGTAGKGLNRGILYMFAMPYLLVGTLGFLWWKNRKNYDSENE